MTTDSKFPLRLTQAERATVETIQADAERAGVPASLNDVIRHLVRAALLDVPLNEAAAKAEIRAHWTECDVCDSEGLPKCLDGLRLYRNYRRFAEVSTA